MVNLREDVIPIMDLRLRLGKPEKQYNAQTCILIVTVADKPFGLIVDAVNNVETIRNEEINDPPRQGAKKGIYYSYPRCCNSTGFGGIVFSHSRIERNITEEKENDT